jgi:hypothetical protein
LALFLKHYETDQGGQVGRGGRKGRGAAKKAVFYFIFIFWKNLAFVAFLANFGFFGIF